MADGFIKLSAFLFAGKGGVFYLKILKPQYRFLNVMQITPEDIKKSGARAVLVDADNTLAFHGSQQPYPGAVDWLRSLAAAGIPAVIISNNNRERIKPFAEKLGLPFVEKSAKPLPKGFLKACKRLGVSPRETAVIGDQIFTDVLGGNIIGAKAFLTEPLGPETDKFIKLKRHFEKWVK